MNNYLIDTKEFCRRAVDKHVYRSNNEEAFQGMIDFLKTADTGSYIASAQTPEAAIAKVYDWALNEGKLG